MKYNDLICVCRAPVPVLHYDQYPPRCENCGGIIPRYMINDQHVDDMDDNMQKLFMLISLLLLLVIIIMAVVRSS